MDGLDGCVTASGSVEYSIGLCFGSMLESFGSVCLKDRYGAFAFL